MRAAIATFAPRPTPVNLSEVIDPVGFAYTHLLEHSGDLMDVAMKTTDKREAAVLVALAQGMAERMDVVKDLALQRLQKLNEQ